MSQPSHPNQDAPPPYPTPPQPQSTSQPGTHVHTLTDLRSTVRNLYHRVTTAEEKIITLRRLLDRLEPYAVKAMSLASDAEHNSRKTLDRLDELVLRLEILEASQGPDAFRPARLPTLRRIKDDIEALGASMEARLTIVETEIRQMADDGSEQAEATADSDE